MLKQLLPVVFLLGLGITHAAEDKAPPVDAVVSRAEFDLMQQRIAMIKPLLARVDVLERALQSNGLLDLLQQIERMQEELNTLYGTLEVQEHKLEKLIQRQRELYAFLDHRLQNLEINNTAAYDPEMPTPDNLQDLRQTVEDIPTTQYADVSSTADTPDEITSLDTDDSAAIAEPEPAQNNPAQAKIAYQAGFSLLRKEQYGQAIKAFEEFLQTYADSQYADNAQYWLAEAYYITEDYNMAIKAYQSMLKTYPDSEKTVRAKLKLGYSHEALGQPFQATRYFTEVIQQHPETTSARLAKDRLDQLKATAE